MVLNLLNLKIIDKEIAKEFMIVFAREVNDDSQEQIHPIAVPILKEFTDVFPEKLRITYLWCVTSTGYRF